MDEIDELRKRYEDLRNECKKCTEPSRCPVCGTMKELVRISDLLSTKSKERT